MTETRTEIKVDIYSGVPFNTKYQNVLFVDKQTRDLFLSQYSIGNEITVGRFDIINDNQAIIDISNDYGTMSVNYIKVHKTLRPETSNTVYEYDLFYFVDHTLQVATNGVRLFLDLDIFQTYFVKYNYQTQAYEIPEIKNSRCEISTENFTTQKDNILPQTIYQDGIYYSPLIDFVSDYGAKCHIVICFTSDDSQYVAISKIAYNCLGTISQGNTQGYDFNTIINECIGQSKPMFLPNRDGTITAHNIDVQNVYIIPQEYVTDYVSNFSNLATSYYEYNMGGSIGNIHKEFYLTNAYGTNLIYPFVKYEIIKTFNHENKPDFYTVGTFSKQIELPYTNGNTSIQILLSFGTTFKIEMFCNNQTLDLTDEFEYSILESQYAQYMQQHQNGLAIKSIASVLNLASGIGSVASGNPAGIVSLTNTIKDTAGEIATFIDLKNQPLKVNITPSVQNTIGLLNGIGIFASPCTNRDEILKTEKYFGFKMNYLTSKTFTFMSVESNKNFDYYKFSNVEITGKLQESFKSRFEQMFLNGVRFWYTTSKFLNTIENTEQTQNENTPITILV